MPRTPPAVLPAIRPPIGLVGPWVANKGDQMMLRAVTDHLSGRPLAAPVELWSRELPDPRMLRVALPPTITEARAAAARKHVLRLGTLAAKGALFALPGGVGLRLTGHGDARSLGTLLDCSGFAYGDEWSTARTWHRARYYQRLARAGTRVVMLPQAFGPFEKPGQREAARALFGACALVYARDEESLGHVQGLDLDAGTALRRAPDVTHLLSVPPPPDAEAWARRAVIVPNQRMLDRTAPDRAAAYGQFLQDAISAVRAAGLDPWLLLHERNDRALLDAVSREAGGGVRVFEGDGVALKGVIGAAGLVVASRYHALVSALSQGVPAIGTSWSHKYDRLFAAYGQERYLLAPEGDEGERRARLDEALSPGGQAEARARLAARADRCRDEVEAMWRAVEAVIGGALPPAEADEGRAASAARTTPLRSIA